MRAVDRADFCITTGPEVYQDRPLPIGHDATISAPHMHAYALMLLKDHLHGDAQVLDVGSGSGYLAVVMAHMLGPGGQVIGIDCVPELVRASRINVARRHGHLLQNGEGARPPKVTLMVGDGWKGVEGRQFDAIHVGAAAAELPEALVRQLRPGGRMVIPLGRDYQELYSVDKDRDGTVSSEAVLGVRYVPLVHM
eukprot:CAMPEP_0206016720 /NCGR_PEP_ID=MMETSP1464-20131121/23407_1 /ASSEMBLY_ACC=CAM_ASM_001124 /TAXON_ID=119497 /ORGANISM="Exanthemachrysis gayraliae, Strain RCC1523" /LENGTH=194 /DNA_ID=CAMNT_0053390545 /DNA_START=36 /DNA_END=620 /DNA_ORIENTATION=+